MKVLLLILSIILSISSCSYSQNRSHDNFRLIGGPCEGCEAIFEYGDRELSPVDTMPDFNDTGQKIKVTGIVYKPDGNTPAPNVILYIYHTNQNGIYENKYDAKNWEKRHGYIRGWIKTGVNGQYTFYTLKPGKYPQGNIPAHIHFTILEPNGKYYWLGSCHFKGDPLLTAKEKSPDNPRCGSSGLLDLKLEGDLWVGKRDIILGKNVPGYE